MSKKTLTQPVHKKNYMMSVVIYLLWFLILLKLGRFPFAAAEYYISLP